MRLYPNVSYARTITGRLAATKPNVLAMPKHSAWGKEIRKCFRAEPGYVIASWDLNQIEMRVMAHLSQDKNLMRAYLEGRDIHAQTAQKVFGVPPEKQDESLHRLPAKTTGFGTIMGLQAYGLMQQLHKYGQLDWDDSDTPNKGTQWLLDGWFETYPGTLEFQKQSVTDARKNGYALEAFSGRKWPLPGINYPINRVRAEAERRSYALRIQSGAQTIIKKAMRHIDAVELPQAREKGYDIEPLLQIHDDLIFHVEKRAVPFWHERMVYSMTEAAKPEGFSLPIKVKGAAGPSWGELSDI